MKFSSLIGTFVLMIAIAGCSQRTQRAPLRQSAIRSQAYSQRTAYPAPLPTPLPAMPAPPQTYPQITATAPVPVPAPIHTQAAAHAAPAYPTQAVMPVPMPATSSSVPPKKEVAMILPPITKKRKFNEKGLIVIDPGHGGDDYGTHSHGKPTYHEKYLNLTTAEMLKTFLKKYGYKVVMTRNDDTFISLENRAIFANEKNAKLFVSVHYNSAPSRDAEGVEVFYYRSDKDKSRSAQSKILAQCVLEKILKNTKAKSRGIKHGNYSVIRETKMPAILIEGGFLTNSNELEKLKNNAYLKSMAFGIAQGIKDYLAKESVLAEK